MKNEPPTTMIHENDSTPPLHDSYIVAGPLLLRSSFAPWIPALVHPGLVVQPHDRVITRGGHGRTQHIGRGIGRTQHIGRGTIGRTQHIGRGVGRTQHIGRGIGRTQYIGRSAGQGRYFPLRRTTKKSLTLLAVSAQSISHHAGVVQRQGLLLKETFFGGNFLDSRPTTRTAPEGDIRIEFTSYTSSVKTEH